METIFPIYITNLLLSSLKLLNRALKYCTNIIEICLQLEQVNHFFNYIYTVVLFVVQDDLSIAFCTIINFVTLY